MKFNGICILTRDVTRLTDFYSDVLRAKTEGDDVHAFVHVEGASFAIYNDGSEGFYSAGNVCLLFDVEDADREAQRIQGMGIELTMEPTSHPWGLRSFEFSDPDGNNVVFRSPVSPEE